MSTGENFVEDVPHKDQALIQLVMRSNVKEVVVPKGFRERIIVKPLSALHVSAYFDPQFL